MASFLVYVFILPSIEPMKNFDDERVGGGDRCLQSLCADSLALDLDCTTVLKGVLSA